MHQSLFFDVTNLERYIQHARYTIQGDISGAHSVEFEDESLLGYGTM
jgi:hypothetical protein